jgi:hypothetical protein
MVGWLANNVPGSEPVSMAAVLRYYPSFVWRNTINNLSPGNRDFNRRPPRFEVPFTRPRRLVLIAEYSFRWYVVSDVISTGNSYFHPCYERCHQTLFTLAPFLIRIQDFPGSIHGPETGYPAECFPCFPHALQTRAGVLPKIMP